jgi:aryl-alcohol dehydrogenase-like predicted oxidoreductase
MEQRQLGANGPLVSALGLGCMGMSYHRSTVLSASEANALIRHAPSRPYQSHH